MPPDAAQHRLGRAFLHHRPHFPEMDGTLPPYDVGAPYDFRRRQIVKFLGIRGCRSRRGQQTGKYEKHRYEQLVPLHGILSHVTCQSAQSSTPVSIHIARRLCSDTTASIVSENASRPPTDEPLPSQRTPAKAAAATAPAKPPASAPCQNLMRGFRLCRCASRKRTWPTMCPTRRDISASLIDAAAPRRNTAFSARSSSTSPLQRLHAAK